jgi:hypothetical protein
VQPWRCSAQYFFVHSGDRMWQWFNAQLPKTAHPPWDRAGRSEGAYIQAYNAQAVVDAEHQVISPPPT